MDLFILLTLFFKDYLRPRLTSVRAEKEPARLSWEKIRNDYHLIFDHGRLPQKANTLAAGKLYFT